MANEVVSLRISDKTKEMLQKVFGQNMTTSEMIRATIDTYLSKIKKTEMGIIDFEIPINCLNEDELKKFYADVCEMEKKIVNSVIDSGYEYNLDYIKAIQNTKNALIAHLSIENGAKYNSENREKLNSLIREKREGGKLENEIWGL